MKVLLANSPFRGGGITTYAVQLIRCLSEDVELSVVLADDAKAPIKDDRVKVYYHNTHDLTVKNARFFIELINNKIKPDVVIVSAARILPVIVPYLNDNIKVITVSHSGRFFHSEYSAVNHTYIDCIIAASSEYNKEYLTRRCKVNPDKIKVIYNFLDRDEEFENYRFLKPQQRPLSIIFVNGSSVHKSPDLVAKVLLKLLKTDLQFKFYWMGNPTIPMTTTVFKHSRIKSVKQLFPNNDERLVFPGYIANKRDFDRFTACANIMIAPSRNEGCSMALIEGHRAGCMFLVADYKNSNKEIVEKGKSGIVVSHNDIDGFVNIIRDIITNPNKYEKYYENAYKTYIQYLSYPIWKEKIFSVINSPSSHKHRKKNATWLGLQINILKMKWLLFKCPNEQTIRYSVPSFFAFQKMYYTIRKHMVK